MNETAWPQNLKKTKIRKAILEVLDRADTPISALQIANEILKTAERLWLSTLYRGLEALTETGLVRRIDLTESHFALYELESHKHGHYAICLSCRKMILIKNCPFGDYQPLIADKAFKILNHKVEIYGYCGNCLKKYKLKKDQ